MACGSSNISAEFSLLLYHKLLSSLSHSQAVISKFSLRLQQIRRWLRSQAPKSTSRFRKQTISATEMEVKPLYDGLDRDCFEIRLLEIFPSSDDDAVLELRLHKVSLEDEPEYMALSYVWGFHPSLGTLSSTAILFLSRRKSCFCSEAHTISFYCRTGKSPGRAEVETFPSVGRCYLRQSEGQPPDDGFVSF